MLVYVDDLLVSSLSPKGIEDVRSSLETSLKVKTTGAISSSRGEGGSLMFLGRQVIRPQKSPNVFVRVPPQYLEELFTNEPFCADLKASPVPPDLLAILEKGQKDPASVNILSDEAASRYKKIVGKLAWRAQSRPDHARFISLLATGQADPTNLHENTLRKYLRFVRTVAHMYQQYPANSASVPFYDGLRGVSDASWGSSDSEKRRSISGGAIFWKGSLLKGYSRLQHCVTLSSCESEVIAVCQISQECIGLRHLVEFLESFTSPDELSKFHSSDITMIRFDQVGSNNGRESYPIIVFSDSQSGLAALQNQGLSRRVRHMSLATCFVQSLVEAGHLVLTWISGKLCVADLLTKILNRESTEFHRLQLGITEVTAPESWQFELRKKSKNDSKVPTTQSKTDAKGSELTDEQSCVDVDEGIESFKVSLSEPNGAVLHEFSMILDELRSEIQADRISHVLVELFTSGDAGFSQIKGIKKFASLGVIPVTKNHPMHVVQQLLTTWLDSMCSKHHNLLVMVWSSPPCTGGPVLNLIGKSRRTELQGKHLREFEQLMKSSEDVMETGHIRCLELSRSCAYWNHELVQSFCQCFMMRFISEFPRCSYLEKDVLTARHTYRVASTIKLCEPRECMCQGHQALNHQRLESLAQYPSSMAVQISTWFLGRTRALVAAS